MENISESDSQKDQPQADVIAELEYILSDDYLTVMNTKADATEDILNSSVTTSQEKEQLIRELDAEWIYMEREVATWGTLLSPKVQHPSGAMTYNSKVLKGEKLQSAGFAILPFAAVIDEEVVLQYKVAYAFAMNGSHAAILREGFTGDFPDSTPDMARRRLEYHYPLETERARELAQLPDEASATTPVLNFRDYSIDFLTRAKGHDEYIADMQTYLFELMRFDRQLPYYVTCELDEFDDGTDSSTVHIIASPVRIVLHLIDKDDNSTNPKTHIPLLVLSVFDSDKSKPNTLLTLPLHGLRSFESIRNAGGYGGEEKG